MTGTDTFEDYLLLGESLCHLRNPQVSTAQRYRNEIERFFVLIDKHGFDFTRAAASSLNQIDIVDNHVQKKIDIQVANSLRTLMNSIYDTLHKEAGNRRHVLSNEEALPLCLREFYLEDGVSKLKDHQEALRQDLIRCIKVSAYRPAIVIAWSLCIDMIRYWIFSDNQRRNDFNKSLSSKTKDNREIKLYEDFFKESEAFVLELCKKTEGSLSAFTDKTHRALQNSLDDRNMFAHANYSTCSESEAKTYVERIIRILDNQPFTETS